MKNRTIVSIGILSVLMVSGLLLYAKWPRPAEVRLEISGTEGLRFGLQVSADGETNSWTGSVPTHCVMSARNADFRVWMEDSTGVLQTEMIDVGGTSCLLETASDQTVCHLWIDRSWSGDSMGAAAE